MKVKPSNDLPCIWGQCSADMQCFLRILCIIWICGSCACTVQLYALECVIATQCKEQNGLPHLLTSSSCQGDIFDHLLRILDLVHHLDACICIIWMHALSGCTGVCHLNPVQRAKWSSASTHKVRPAKKTFGHLWPAAKTIVFCKRSSASSHKVFLANFVLNILYFATDWYANYSAIC